MHKLFSKVQINLPLLKALYLFPKYQCLKLQVKLIFYFKPLKLNSLFAVLSHIPLDQLS